ncbi:Zn-ribbon domain-containing OB-fold protein [Rhodococcus sp. NPDC058505]|uniref:Zn-ribbon domain-containing OB-fold protein n=1 Tax=unclassified Rhodococcus (in: high G+C Gram-positive bacteria) TaxID=192944 RepID=UPI0036514449
MSVDAVTRPFETEAFMLRCCGSCSALYAPETWVCTSCDGNLEWVPSTGQGAVVSWTRLDPANAGASGRGLDPLTIAIVELDEGPWIYAAIEGGHPDAAPGRARVVFAQEPVVGRFPVFVLDPAGSE